MTTTTTIIIPSNPADQKQILDAIKEADESLFKIEGERGQIKAIIDALADKFPDLDKKNIRRMIITYHKQNFAIIDAESADFAALYTTIVKV